jgi:hypothetical protein
MQVDKNIRYVGGARNPYALAELISGQKIDWETMSSSEKRQKLEKIFNSPYEKLFSPQHDSPLYSDRLKIKR